MAVAALPLALSLAGTAFEMIGQSKQAAATKRAEEARKGEMLLEQKRTRREAIRQAQVARAQAVAAGTNQGAGGSSALLGGEAQVLNTGYRNVQSSFSSEKLGLNVFRANQDFAEAGKLGAIGQGLGSLGGAIASNTGTLTRIGAGYRSPFRAYA